MSHFCGKSINEECEEPVECDHCDIDNVRIKMAAKAWKLLGQQILKSKLQIERRDTFTTLQY